MPRRQRPLRHRRFPRQPRPRRLLRLRRRRRLPSPDPRSRATTIDPFVDRLADEELRETTVDSRIVHRGRTMAFRVDTIERPDGSRHQREIVAHPGAVAIVAVDDADRVLLVRQFRTAAGRTLLEIPAGTRDVDEATGEVEDPDRTAARELEEETGQRAAAWQQIGAFWPAPGFSTEVIHLYVATGLSPAADGRLGPDEDEALVLVRVPFDEAVIAAEDGRITDAKSIVGLFRYARMRARTTTGA